QLFLLFLLVPRHPRATLFPYTTLFRSHPRPRPVEADPQEAGDEEARHGDGEGDLAEPALVLPVEEEEGDGPEGRQERDRGQQHGDRKSTRLNSSHEWISYAVFCLKKKN